MVYRGSTVGAAPDNTVDPPKLALPGRPAVDVLEAEQRFEDQLLESGRSECCFDAVLDAWAQVLERCPRADGLGPSDIAGAVFGGPAGSELMGFLRATLAVPAWRDAVIVMAAADVAAGQYFLKLAFRRIAQNFAALESNDDPALLAAARATLGKS